MSVQERLSASIAKRAFMASYRGTEAEPARQRPIALVLGTGDIASAIGRELFDLGWNVLRPLVDDLAEVVMRPRPQPTTVAPYGDGRAAEVTVATLEKHLR